MNWVTWVITTTLLFLPFVGNGVDVMGKTTYKLTTPDGAAYYFSEPDCVVNIGIPEGFGLPPLDHNTMTVYKQPGALLTGIQIKPRIITITATLSGDCRLALHQARASLFSALRWNRTNTDPPPASTLTYSHDGKSVNLKVHYLSDVTNSQGETADVIGVRLIAYDPMWYATTPTTTALALSQNLAVAHFVGTINGEWNNFAGGTNGTIIYAIAVAPDGTLYIGGDFTTAGGNAAAKVAQWTGATWAAMDAGLPGTVYALAVGPDGSVYAAGAFPNPHNVMKWNGAAWSDLGAAGTNGDIIYALAVAPDGTLYAGGAFTSIDGVAANRLAKWNGAAWSALGAGVASDEVLALAVAPGNSYLYFGGTFIVAGGVTVNSVGYYDGSTYHAMETGADNAVGALRFGPDGNLYAAGRFHNLGGNAALHVGRWNGSHWYALGSGVNDEAYAIAVASNGTVYLGGNFSQAGNVSIADRVAQWNGSTWAALDIDLPGPPAVQALATYGDDVYLGFSTSGVAVASDDTDVTNAGDADTWPVFTFTGPGYLQSIINRTTGKTLFPALQINAGETVTIDLSPGVKTITSDWRGDLLPYAALLPLSDMGTFALAPDPVAPVGVNSITVLMTGTAAGSTGSVSHTSAYLSVDAAVK